MYLGWRIMDVVHLNLNLHPYAFLAPRWITPQIFLEVEVTLTTFLSSRYGLLKYELKLHCLCFAVEIIYKSYILVI
jgi:hypothetical protein